MFILHIMSAILSSTCQKLLKLMEIWQSSDRNNFAQFFLRHGIYIIYMYNIIFHSVTVWLLTLSIPLFVCVCWLEIRSPPRLTESPLPTLFILGPTRFLNSLPWRLQLSFGREQLGSKGIILYDSWGIRLREGDREGIVPSVQIDPPGSIWIPPSEWGYSQPL